MKPMKFRTLFSVLTLLFGVLGPCVVGSGQVTGKAKLNGRPPKRAPVAGANAVPACAAQHRDPILDETVVADDDGNLQNVVVWLTGEGVKPEVPSRPAVLEQKGCVYAPHVVAMMAGQKLVARNDDPFLHNVHTLPENNEASNIAQVNKGEDTLKPVKNEDIFPVKCDVHPWMKAWVAALPNQYFAVTGEDGAYRIDTKGLPDGTYELHAWQEKYKSAPVARIDVKGGKGEADVAFNSGRPNPPPAPPPQARAAPAPPANGPGWDLISAKESRPTSRPAARPRP